MTEYDHEIYIQQKDFFLAIFRSMKPAENARKEMQDAFICALEDFCEGIEY